MRFSADSAGKEIESLRYRHDAQGLLWSNEASLTAINTSSLTLINLPRRVLPMQILLLASEFGAGLLLRFLNSNASIVMCAPSVRAKVATAVFGPVCFPSLAFTSDNSKRHARVCEMRFEEPSGLNAHCK